MQEDFEKAYQEEINSGKDEDSINQAELWKKEFSPKRGNVRGRGDLSRVECHSSRPSSSSAEVMQKNRELEAKVSTLEEQLEKTRSENASFQSKLLSALASRGLDFTQVLAPEAPNEEDERAEVSHNNADESSPAQKRCRVATEGEGQDQGDDSSSNHQDDAL